MSSSYPTLRSRPATSSRGAGRALSVPQSTEQAPPRKTYGAYSAFGVSLPDYTAGGRGGGRFQGPLPPLTPFGRKTKSNARYIRALFPRMPLGRVLRLAEQLLTYQGLGPTQPEEAIHPGSGFYMYARCATGGRQDRVHIVSTQFPPNPAVVSLVTGCYVSGLYSPGWVVDQTTRSFMEIEAQPQLPLYPWRGKATVLWARPHAGPVNKVGRIELDETLDDWSRERTTDPLSRVIRAFPHLAPLKVGIGGEYADPLNEEDARQLQRIALPGVQRVVGPPAFPPGRTRLRDAERSPFRRLRPVQSIAFEAGGPPVVGPPHINAPAPRGVKERKLKSKSARFLNRIKFSALTEIADFVESLHDALPSNLRRSRAYRDAEGKWHNRRLDSMLRDLYAAWDQVDLGIAFNNLVANEIEDYTIGAVQRFANNASLSSGEGFGTFLSKYNEQLGQMSPAQIAAKGAEWLSGVSNQKNNVRRDPHEPTRTYAGQSDYRVARRREGLNRALDARNQWR